MSAAALKDTFHRSLPFLRETVNRDARTVELAFSSEAPVDRYFGTEILDHSPSSVDMGRILGRAPLLLDHDPAQQIGVVESARIDADRTARAVVRFSKSARGEEIFQDVVDGIRSLVSVGYRIHKLETEKRSDGSEAQRAIHWEPLEISLVAIPADASVGVGRSEPLAEPPIIEVVETRSPIMSQVIEVPTASNDVLAAERKRVADIGLIAEQHNCPSLAKRGHADGMSAAEFGQLVLREVYKAKPATPTDADIGLSEREARSFSIVKAIRDIASGKGLQGFEKEASEAAAKHYGRSLAPNAFTVPNDVMRRDMTAGTNSAGGYTVQTTVGPLIEMLRNKMVTSAAGVQIMSGLVGNVALPKQTAAGTAYWLAENANITESSQTLAQISMTPHRLGAFTDISKQLIAQSSLDVEGFVRNDLATILALAIDKAVLEGSGSSGQPTGILSTTGVGSVTFGGAPTWAKVVEFETDVATANADIGTMNYVTTAAVRGAWKTTVKTANQAIFLAEQNSTNGYGLLVTNQVSDDKVIFGAFSAASLGIWGGVDVLVDPYGSQAIAGLVRIVAQTYVDVGVRQAGAFAVSADAGNQ